MNGNFDTLLRRSRRWGLCGTTLSGAGMVLSLMGLGPIQELKAQPEPRPPAVVVQLVALQPETRATAQETPAPLVMEHPDITPKISEIPKIPKVMEPEAPAVSQKVVPLKKATHQKTPLPKTAQQARPAPERSPRKQTLAVGTPPPATIATASPAAKKTGEQETQALLGRVVEQLEKHKRYPQAARKLGLEGVVRLQVRFSPQGSITHIRLLDSEAHAMLCKSGMESLRKVQELWKPQPLERETVLDIAVRYTLKK